MNVRLSNLVPLVAIVHLAFLRPEVVFGETPDSNPPQPEVTAASKSDSMLQDEISKVETRITALVSQADKLLKEFTTASEQVAKAEVLVGSDTLRTDYEVMNRLNDVIRTEDNEIVTKRVALNGLAGFAESSSGTANSIADLLNALVAEPPTKSLESQITSTIADLVQFEADITELSEELQDEAIAMNRLKQFIRQSEGRRRSLLQLVTGAAGSEETAAVTNLLSIVNVIHGLLTDPLEPTEKLIARIKDALNKQQTLLKEWAVLSDLAGRLENLATRVVDSKFDLARLRSAWMSNRANDLLRLAGDYQAQDHSELVTTLQQLLEEVRRDVSMNADLAAAAEQYHQAISTWQAAVSKGKSKALSDRVSKAADLAESLDQEIRGLDSLDVDERQNLNARLVSLHFALQQLGSPYDALVARARSVVGLVDDAGRTVIALLAAHAGDAGNDHSIRVQAAASLARLGSRAKTELTSLLISDDSMVNALAVAGVISIGQAAIAELSEIAIDSTMPSPSRRAAARALVHAAVVARETNDNQTREQLFRELSALEKATRRSDDRLSDVLNSHAVHGLNALIGVSVEPLSVGPIKNETSLEAGQTTGTGSSQ